jgi:hypothetical protein
MEAMMNDQIFDREYQAGRTALNDAIVRLFAGAGQALKVLHHINFDAPWKEDAAHRPGAR